mgnify:CR=1 FL=1
MKKKYTYEEILSLDNFNGFTPGEICNLLAIIFETGRENQDTAAIKKGLELAEAHELNDFSDHAKMIFHFYVANGWSYLHQLTHVLTSDEFWTFETPEIENEVINLRKSLSFSENVDDSELKSQVLTNLGNTFDHIGRFVEAIHYWHAAMKLRPGFGMAIGNLGFGLGHYARVLFDEGHRFLFCQYAYRYLAEAAISSDVYVEGQQAFINLANTIEERYGKEILQDIQDLKKFSLGSTKQEKDYREWCIKNALFLNPLNDFIYENIVGHDCLFLPAMTLHKDEPPVYHSIYNQLKQEFVSARYFYYESLNDQRAHFSDKGNMQMDTLDYAVYSLSTEKLKATFRIAYSLFDKIGYVLNAYFQIGMNPKDVSFRKIWHIKSAETKKWELNPLITKSQNWPLRGLYWLSKDLIENETEFSKAILPDAQQIATIRNFIEHKSFKVVDVGETAIVDNGLTYQIRRKDLEQKVYTIMKMARAAIISLSLAIHLEELKSKNIEPSMPMPFFELKDIYKV